MRTRRQLQRSAAAVMVLSLAVSAALFDAPAMASPVTVVHRVRLGNNTEGATLPTTGRWLNHVVAIDGYDVLAIPIDGRRPTPDTPSFRTIFNVRGIGISFPPRGIAHVPTQRRFYFGSADADQADRLFVTDETGRPLPPLIINRPAGHSGVVQYEGMTWIPSTSPSHPNTIAAVVVNDVDFTGHIDYIRLDGTVEEEVTPAPGTPLEAYITGIAYRSPGELLVSEIDQGTYVMGLDGSLRDPAPLITIPEAGDVEGVAVARDGRVLETSYGTGHLFAFNADGTRRANDDRSFLIGLGLSTSFVTWDYDRNQFVFQVSAFVAGGEVGSLVTAPADLGSSKLVAGLDPAVFTVPRGVGYIGGGQVAVANTITPRGIGIFNLSDGTEASHIDLSGLPTLEWRPFTVAPLPDGNLALRVRGDLRPDTPTVPVIDRAGVPQAGIPLSAHLCGDPTVFCTGLTVFDAGGGPEFFTGAAFFGLDGTLHDTVSLADLDLLDAVTATYITAGPWAGNFAVMEGQTSTIVIFNRT